MKGRWAIAALAVAALTLAACGDDDDDDGGFTGGVSQESRDSGRAGATPGAPASGDVAADNGDSTGLPAIDPGRKIIFDAKLTLTADDIERSFSDASALARTNGGYIEKSSYANSTDGTNGPRSATLTIRVPVQNYDSLMANLRTLPGVKVRTEGSASNEVTEQYADLESRQRNLERTEQQYLELLARATSINEILTVQDRLSGVRLQIEQIQGRLQVLDSQTDFATVTVELVPPLAVAQAPKSDTWTLQGVLVGAWENSLEAARYVAAAGLVAMVAFAWLLVPGLIAYFAWRKSRRLRPAGAMAGPTEA